MKKLIIIFLFFTTSLLAGKVERLGFYNLQELLEDDNLTYKIIKSCVSLNSAITEITKEDYTELSKSFFETANYLYPFGILTLAKIKKINYKDAENSWFLKSDESYEKINVTAEDNFSAHSYFMKNPSLSGRGSSINLSMPEKLRLVK